jgi:hypothetical protein
MSCKDNRLVKSPGLLFFPCPVGVTPDDKMYCPYMAYSC